jgi:enoyl-CoA hydratase
MSFVKLEVDNHIGVVTFDRQEALNALNSQMFIDLNKVLDQIENDSDILAVIFTGAGRSFIAGADISEMLPMNPVSGKKWGDLGNATMLRIENLSQPTIAAVNGFAFGGGNELAMCCDIRLASTKAKFGQPEVGLGITPGFGGTQRLSRLVGLSRAMELILTGKTIDAAKAYEIGLVNEIAQPEALMETAKAMAGAIAAQAPIAVSLSKQCIRRGAQMDIQTAVTYESQAFGRCFGTLDQKEGMGAFMEKRNEKNFVGR